MNSNHVDLDYDVIRLFHRWREANAKIRLYGSSMPQSKEIIDDFYQYLEKIFKTISSFSLVKGINGFEMVIHDTDTKEDLFYPIDASENFVQTAQPFETFNIQSITFNKALTSNELQHLFTGLYMSPEEIHTEDGLAGYLKHNNVHHIELDKLRFKLLKDGSPDTKTNKATVATEKALEELLQQTQGLQKHDHANMKKTFVSVWEGYLNDQWETPDFKAQHPDLIALAQEKPEIFIRTLQHMAAKQDKIEAFLAHLEQKLFDVGFPRDLIKRIMSSLRRPKQVLIDEAELARLRQIEKNYQPDLNERIEKSLAEITVLQKKLSDVRERGDAIIRQTSQGVMVINQDSEIMGLNPIAQKVLGLPSQKDAVGRNVKDVIKDHHMLSVVTSWENETDTHIPKTVEIQAHNHDIIDTIRESAIVIEDENGRSVGTVLALQNVAKQHDLENRKNDILDVLGHDLRAPLNIVKQNISLIADFMHQPDTLPVAEQIQFIESCQRHIDRMEKLINKILDMRQLETGKILLKKDHTPSNKLIEDAAYSLDSWAQDKDITITVHAESLPDLYCDPERIYQVITNLMSNALKFTPEGGCILVMGKTIETQAGKSIEISVEDSGVGIQPEDLERIFNKYEQVSLELPAGVSGLGLGLSICKTIIEMHDGKIWAQSHIGKGSIFTFQIPVSSGQDTAP